MKNANLSKLQDKFQEQKKAELDSLLTVLAPELSEVEVSLSELENELGKRENALKFTAHFDDLWDSLIKTPGNQVYDAYKTVHDLENAMEGKVNTALVVSRLPTASAYWTQLATAKFKLRALRRLAQKEVAKLHGISAEEADALIDAETKARLASKPQSQGTKVVNQSKEDTNE